MIPYFAQPQLHLGPITIHAFGVLVATGILLAFRIIRQRAAKQGLDPVLAERLAMRMVIIGFISAHIVDRIAYYPRDVLANPLSLLWIWESVGAAGEKPPTWPASLPPQQNASRNELMAHVWWKPALTAVNVTPA